MKNIFTEHGAKAVWLDTCESLNRYVDFFHDFSLPGPVEKASLYISADTDYTAFHNGSFIDCGQYDDYPYNKAYDVLDLSSFLCAGPNRLGIRAYHQGTRSCQYAPGRPMLVYALVWEGGSLVSGEGGYCRESRDYVSGAKVQSISRQLSFSFEYDARKSDSWLLPGYTQGPEAAKDWKSPHVYSRELEKITFYERPIKKLQFHPPVVSRLIAQGLFFREEQKGLSHGQIMYSDFLSSRDIREIIEIQEEENENIFWGEKLALPARAISIKHRSSGVYLVLDMGREEAGLFYMKINAPENTVVDAAYGEHLDDLRVRSAIEDRNFSFSYTCREGEQEFYHYMKRIAGRYLQLHIHNSEAHNRADKSTARPLVLHYAGIIPAVYPLEVSGVFNTSDRLISRIYEVSKRTLELCLHEHYEDCPWREQGLYAYDSRNQMLSGYYINNNFDVARANIALFTEQLLDNGFLRHTAPSAAPYSIPYFSMIWIVSLREYALYSGDLEGAGQFFTTAERLVETMEKFLDQGLVATPQGAEYWNFYEWVPGLDGPPGPGQKDEQPLHFDAPLNASFCLALDAMIDLAEWLDKREQTGHWQEVCKTLKLKFNEHFWDASKNIYASFTDLKNKHHYAELTQALALCANIPGGERRRLLLARLADRENGLVPGTVSSLIFKYQALLGGGEEYAPAVFQDILDKWGHMLFNRATSFWETVKGADDFNGAGSLCHGWTAIPAYFFFAYILGIRPLKPGFKEYTVSPVRLPLEASGSIMTPNGKITVKVKNGSLL